MNTSAPNTPEPHAAPSTATELEQLRRANHELGVRNTKLTELLTVSRDKLAALRYELEAMATPPSTYGVFLEPSQGGATAEVFTANRRMRLVVSPQVDPQTLQPGARVRIGEGSQVVEVCGFETTGELATLTELLGTQRALVVDARGDERVVELAGPLQRRSPSPRAGDTVLFDARAGVAFEVIPKAEVARLALEEVPDVSYADIGGLDSQIELIQDAVELPFSHPQLYHDFALRPPKGVLLYGPPGCGKTLIAKAVAHSLATRIGDGSRSYFINVKGPELLNKFVGETERHIRIIFERARELASEGRPVIVFFDEMESIFRTRGSGVSSDMETTVVPQLLAELDGVEGLTNVIVIGATNREELIDPAILRPGRLDVKIRVGRPNKAEARDIFARYITDAIPLEAQAEQLIAATVDYAYQHRPFVELTLADGMTEVLTYSDFISGAMIANIVDRAKKNAIKDRISGGSLGVAQQHLIAAVDAEFRENEDLPNTASPDEWTRITGGKVGKKVLHVRVISGDN